MDTSTAEAEVNGLLNLECLYFEMKYRYVKYIPIPCEYKYTAICKPKQPGDQAVIRQCQTNHDPTTFTTDEAEHRTTAFNKPDLTSTTLSTETEFLTSSLATMSTHIISTTSDHTTIIPSSPKGLSTKFISSERSSVWSSLKTVSTSSSQTSISDNIISTYMELTTSDAQMDNDDRTVENETINNDLVYSIIFFLVPAAIALAILIIMAVLITVVRRRRREKAHKESNGLQIEPGAIQPMIAYKKKAYDAKSKSTSPTMFHSSSELNNISNSVEASISTQSLTGIDSVYSTLKLSTAIKSSSDLGTFSTTENTIGNSTFDQSTTRIGQRKQTLNYCISTYRYYHSIIHIRPLILLYEVTWLQNLQRKITTLFQHCKFKSKEDHFTKGKNAMFELKGIVDESDRNLQKTPLFYQSPSTKTIPSEETVAYCDTAIVHQEFLYDVPKNSIIDGVRNPNNNFTGEQKAVAIIPSKEINQLKVLVF
ncbi:unnamed protein product [Mytilus edulis]|uniref:Uncharacterized protein n=1 Tax=Mytilus edulis TaxID=6550 RepID=A0A8S3Q721_MYTED|nr:unnamed protein product [Mytilus edulis]